MNKKNDQGLNGSSIKKMISKAVNKHICSTIDCKGSCYDCNYNQLYTWNDLIKLGLIDESKNLAEIFVENAVKSDIESSINTIGI